MLFFKPPENIRKPKSFLIFSRGIEKQHRAAMGKIRLLLETKFEGDSEVDN